MGRVEILSRGLSQSSPIVYVKSPAKADKSRMLAEMEQHRSQNSYDKTKTNIQLQ